MHRPIVLLVLALALALTGCQGLASALGVQPAATAPVFNGVGIVVQPGAEVWVDGVSPDQSGNVAAKGEGSQTTEQGQVVTVDPAAVAEGIAAVAKEVLPGGRAAAMLAKAEAALAGGDAAKAQKLAQAAAGFARSEKADAEPEAPAVPETPAAPTPAPEQP